MKTDGPLEVLDLHKNKNYYINQCRWHQSGNVSLNGAGGGGGGAGAVLGGCDVVGGAERVTPLGRTAGLGGADAATPSTSCSNLMVRMEDYE